MTYHRLVIVVGSVDVNLLTQDRTVIIVVAVGYLLRPLLSLILQCLVVLHHIRRALMHAHHALWPHAGVHRHASQSWMVHHWSLHGVWHGGVGHHHWRPQAIHHWHHVGGGRQAVATCRGGEGVAQWGQRIISVQVLLLLRKLSVHSGKVLLMGRKFDLQQLQI